MATYKIVVSGKVLPGYELEDVKENLARAFKLNNPEQKEKAFARIFYANPMVFKKGLDEGQAKAYQAALKKAGLGSAIEAEAPVLEMTSDIENDNQKEPASVAAVVTPEAQAELSDQHNKAQNSDAPSTADLETAVADGEVVLVDPQKTPASAGVDWIKEGYSYFKQGPVTWIGMVFLFFAITIVLSLIPLVSIILNIFNPVFIAGFMLACYKLSRSESFGIEDLFAGFKRNFGRLAAVGAVYLVSVVVIGGVFLGLMFGVMDQEQLEIMAQTQDPAILFSNSFLLMLIFILLISVVMMAYIFAPALIMLHDIRPMEAMKLSFIGCWRNMLPLLVYGIVATVLGFIAMIPFGLGLFILMPVLTASIFSAYRQIYTEPAI
jgi:uncharacterized membrane protein